MCDPKINEMDNKEIKVIVEEPDIEMGLKKDDNNKKSKQVVAPIKFKCPVAKGTQPDYWWV